MKLTISSTEKVVVTKGIQLTVFEGFDENGQAVEVHVASVTPLDEPVNFVSEDVFYDITLNIE